jgi:nicotinate-nucleotide pyrophosphorylase
MGNRVLCGGSLAIVNALKGQVMKKTFHISMHVSYEYFVEADSFEEAQTKIINCEVESESEDLIEWVLLDEHDGNDWANEPTGNTK